MFAARASIEKKMIEERDGTADPNAYSPKYRRGVYEEQLERDAAAEKKKNDESMFKDYNDMMDREKAEASKPIPIYAKNGNIRQANQGKYEWRYDESSDKTCVIFEIKLPKFMETSMIDCDLHPDYVRLDIKGRITQLSHPEFIIVEKSKVQRSTTTGVLQITMPKECFSEIQAREMRIKKKMEWREHEKKLRALEKA